MMELNFEIAQFDCNQLVAYYPQDTATWVVVNVKPLRSPIKTVLMALRNVLMRLL